VSGDDSRIVASDRGSSDRGKEGCRTKVGAALQERRRKERDKTPARDQRYVGRDWVPFVPQGKKPCPDGNRLGRVHCLEAGLAALLEFT